MANPRPTKHRAKPTDSTNTLPLQGVVASPFNQSDWSARSRKPLATASKADFGGNRLPLTSFLPFNQQVWINPAPRARQNASRAELFVNLTPLQAQPGVGTPFVSFDWANPAVARSSAGARSTAPQQGIPTGFGAGDSGVNVAVLRRRARLKTKGHWK